MEKAHKMRIKPRVRTLPGVLVPIDTMEFENDPALEDMDEEEELTPEFMEGYIRLNRNV
jgi:hypothetical protein